MRSRYPVTTGGTPRGNIVIISSIDLPLKFLNSIRYAVGKATSEANTVAKKAPLKELRISTASTLNISSINIVKPMPYKDFSTFL